MSVYVDEIAEYHSSVVATKARHNGTRWSHMWCDAGEEEQLHRIAQEIGLKREWFDAAASVCHYDVTPPKRALAISRGAIAKPMRQWLREETAEQRTARRTRQRNADERGIE